MSSSLTAPTNKHFQQIFYAVNLASSSVGRASVNNRRALVRVQPYTKCLVYFSLFIFLKIYVIIYIENEKGNNGLLAQ